MAASAYGCAVGGLAQAVLTIVRKFRQINPESIAWDAQQLAYPERNVDLFRARVPAKSTPDSRCGAPDRLDTSRPTLG